MPNKTFFTYEQQIEKLTKEKQLVLSDTEFVKDTLQKLSYFSLIGGYKDLFAVVIALRYLIPNKDFKVFRKILSLLIKDVLKKCPHLTEDQLLNIYFLMKNFDLTD